MADKEYGPDYWAQSDDPRQSEGDRGQGRYGDDRYSDKGRYDDDPSGGGADRYGNPGQNGFGNLDQVSAIPTRTV